MSDQFVLKEELIWHIVVMYERHGVSNLQKLGYFFNFLA